MTERPLSSFFPTYQLSFNIESIGRTFGHSKRKITWKFGITNAEAIDKGIKGVGARGSEHEIVFVWSVNSGKKSISVDGEEIHYSEGNKSSKVSHLWLFREGYELKIEAHSSPPMSATPGYRQYDLWVNNLSFFKMPKPFELGVKGYIERHNPGFGITPNSHVAQERYSSYHNDIPTHGQREVFSYNDDADDDHGAQYSTSASLQDPPPKSSAAPEPASEVMDLLNFDNSSPTHVVAYHSSSVADTAATAVGLLELTNNGKLTAPVASGATTHPSGQQLVSYDYDPFSTTTHQEQQQAPSYTNYQLTPAEKSSLNVSSTAAVLSNVSAELNNMTILADNNNKPINPPEPAATKNPFDFVPGQVQESNHYSSSGGYPFDSSGGSDNFVPPGGVVSGVPLPPVVTNQQHYGGNPQPPVVVSTIQQPINYDPFGTAASSMRTSSAATHTNAPPSTAVPDKNLQEIVSFDYTFGPPQVSNGYSNYTLSPANASANNNGQVVAEINEIIGGVSGVASSETTVAGQHQPSLDGTIVSSPVQQLHPPAVNQGGAINPFDF